jgi:hypothetical protein
MFNGITSRFGGASKKTFKPVKGHKEGSKHEQLHSYSRTTLGRYTTAADPIIFSY